jgi:hypothetical protein
MKQSEHWFIEEVTQAKRLDVTPQFVFSKIHIAQCEDVWLNEVPGLEESARFLPCLEDESHLSELRGTWANI